MQDVENALSKGEGDVRAGGTVRNVDEEIGASDIDLFPVQTRPRILPETLKFWV